MKNLKTGKKLAVTFGIIVVLFCIVVTSSIFSLMTSGGKFENFYEKGYQITSKTMDMRRMIQSAAKNVGYATMVDDAAKTKEYIDAAQANMTELADGIAYLRENFQENIALIDSLHKGLDESKNLKQQVFDYALANKNEQAADVYFNQYNPYLLDAIDLLTQINEAAAKNADNNYLTARRLEMITMVVLAVLAVITLGVTIILGIYITKSLTAPIQEIEAAARAMAKGKLNAKITYRSRDELGSLSESMRITVAGLSNIVNDVDMLLGAMADGNFQKDTKAEQNYIGDFEPILLSMRNIGQRLSDTLNQINMAADQVAGGSDQVSSGAQALSQGATEQASSIQELAATINEISGQVKENAENAQQASKKANAVGTEMAESNQKMQDMIHAMDEISSSSSEISKIIKTIEDIAFQTNILALNAAVEAARAGAAGKGFAVVADEVRNLASKSAEASKNTAALIESSIRAVENGTKIAGETAHAMVSAVEGAKDVSNTIERISDATNNQAQSIVQVTQGVDQISSVVQTNSATAEESAAASEELSGQAQILKNLVGRFHLKNTDGLAGPGYEEFDRAEQFVSQDESMPVNSVSKY